jgi:hypothetical protein
MVPQIFDMSAHEARLDRLISQSFSASFMSNSKWRRLFLALTAPELGVHQLVWKFVGRDLPIRGAAPDAECLGETIIRDTSFAPFPYKEIEWIEIPRANIRPGDESVPFKHRPQDPEAAQRILDALGQFEMTLLPEGLRVYGYQHGA